MSLLGNFYGEGGSVDKHASVLCPQCNTENAIQDDNIQYTSSSRLILCKSCEEEVILDNESTYPGESSCTTSEFISDGGTSELQPGCESGVGGQEESVELPLGLRPRSHNRRLKASTSNTESSSEREDSMMIQHSASLSTITGNEFGKRTSSELTEDSLKQLSKMMKEHPCPNCGCAERDLLSKVEGIRDLFHCLSCNRPYGLDDGMNFFDFQEFLEAGYRMDPCPICKNDDPEKFTLEQSGTGHTDVTTDLVVRCGVCKNVLLSGLDQVVKEEEENLDAIKASCNMECSSCENRDSKRFEINLNTRINTIETVCLDCNDRKAAKVTGQICSCKAASTSYSFDEYGYINEVKCDICGATMNTSDDVRKTTPSDGTSRGRTRIRSLDMIRPGDHIAWHQWLGYWHHAIIIEVQFTFVNLIHYNGPSAHKGVIIDEWIELDPSKEEVYRIDYHREARNHDPKPVIERAKSRVGEHSYNLLTNNCEHFARWCVTGQHRSLQVQTFYESIMSRVNVAAKGRLAQSLTENGFDFASKRNLQLSAVAGDRMLAVGKQFLGSGDLGAKRICTKMAAGEAKSVASGKCTKRLSAAFAVGYEVYSVIADIHEAHRQRAVGAIDRREFLKVTIKRSCEGVGSMAGTAVTLAIPVASNVVGLTLSTIIGKAVGAFLGRNAARLVDKVAPLP